VIIKGKSRAGPAALAAHLGNAEKNERVTLLETRGTIARDLRGALVEMDAYAAGTRCEKSLYHAAISPEPPHRLSEDQRMQAIDALEEKLGLTGHSRVVVMHEKLGREHIHVVWSRIDLHHMKSVSDSHNYRKHEEVSRDLERRFGHDRVQGAHHERDGVERPERTPSRAELRQEERTGIKGKDVGMHVTALFQSSDNAEAFRNALEGAGYILAKGDRRDFVIVDRAGGIHSLSRRIHGMHAADLRKFMAPIDREKLPNSQDARVIAKGGIEHKKVAKVEANYSQGADFVHQTLAALKDHQRRQTALNQDAQKPVRIGSSETDQRIKRMLAEDGREKRQRKDSAHEASTEQKREDRTEIKPADTRTDAKSQRMRRMLGDDGGRDDDPDRQRGVPGGGRTRSR
jgi:hypothetical protein